MLAEWFPTAPDCEKLSSVASLLRKIGVGRRSSSQCGSPDLSRPLAEREAVFLGQNGPGPEGIQGLEDSRSRKGLGLGPPHTSQLHRENVQPAPPILAQCQLRQCWGCFLLWAWIKGNKGQGLGVSVCLKAPSCFAGCPLFHLHLLAFVSKSLHQSHRRAKTFHPSPAQRFHRAC